METRSDAGYFATNMPNWQPIMLKRRGLLDKATQKAIAAITFRNRTAADFAVNELPWLLQSRL
jgi:hypothetical protein